MSAVAIQQTRVIPLHSSERKQMASRLSRLTNLLCRGKKSAFVQWYFPNSGRSSRKFQINCNSYNVQRSDLKNTLIR